MILSKQDKELNIYSLLIKAFKENPELYYSEYKKYYHSQFKRRNQTIRFSFSIEGRNLKYIETGIQWFYENFTPSVIEVTKLDRYKCGLQKENSLSIFFPNLLTRKEKSIDQFIDYLTKSIASRKTEDFFNGTSNQYIVNCSSITDVLKQQIETRKIYTLNSLFTQSELSEFITEKEIESLDNEMLFLFCKQYNLEFKCIEDMHRLIKLILLKKDYYENNIDMSLSYFIEDVLEFFGCCYDMKAYSDRDVFKVSLEYLDNFFLETFKIVKEFKDIDVDTRADLLIGLLKSYKEIIEYAYNSGKIKLHTKKIEDIFFGYYIPLNDTRTSNIFNYFNIKFLESDLPKKSTLFVPWLLQVNIQNESLILDKEIDRKKKLFESILNTELTDLERGSITDEVKKLETLRVSLYKSIK